MSCSILVRLGMGRWRLSLSEMKVANVPSLRTGWPGPGGGSLLAGNGRDGKETEEVPGRGGGKFNEGNGQTGLENEM